MFYRLKNLLKLHLQDNPISEWGNDTSQCANCFEKWYVNLSETKILDSLRRGTQVFNRAQIRDLDLSSNNISLIMDTNIFAGARIQTIYLNNNNISHIPRNAFYTASLSYHPKGVFFTTIYLNDNKITSLYAVAFEAIQRKLYYLYLDHNEIFYIEVGTFHMPYLNTLSLSYNNISHLPPGIFENNEKLQNLNLSYNKISCLTAGVFTLKLNRPSNIINLDLGYNRLIELNSTLFKDLNNILNLSLNNNNISIMQKTTFSKMKNLRNLVLNCNYLKALYTHLFRHLGKLEHLDLRKNTICYIDKLAFKYNWKLNSLLLDGNNLTMCLWLEDLPKDVQVLQFNGPFVNNDICLHKMNCSSFGKQSTIKVSKFKNYSYEFCQCQCMLHNCTDECDQNEYHIVQNEYGCSECKCLSASADYDYNKHCNNSSINCTRGMYQYTYPLQV